MRVLLDECVDFPLAAALAKAGFDVERATPGLPDEEVLHQANTSRRILITMDYGFGERVIRHVEKAEGVVLIANTTLDRRDPNRFTSLAERLQALQNTLRGHLTVIDAKRTRARHLPAPNKRNE